MADSETMRNFGISKTRRSGNCTSVQNASHLVRNLFLSLRAFGIPPHTTKRGDKLVPRIRHAKFSCLLPQPLEVARALVGQVRVVMRGSHNVCGRKMCERGHSQGSFLEGSRAQMQATTSEAQFCRFSGCWMMPQKIGHRRLILIQLVLEYSITIVKRD